MIILQNIYKQYTKNTNNHALYDVSLHVEKGDIFGIIGFSGAGKSTLLRTINFLEKPSKGNVIINGVLLNNLSNSALACERKNIGIIFQHFNLLKSKNIYKNIALPLEINKTPKKIINARVNELIKLVGLEKLADKYPSSISGGQKQRVGIARALTTYPKILLCDEATSALDPVTTLSILDLLKDINQKMGLTIVLITHELHVVKAICNKIVVLNSGKIIDIGKTHTVLNNPTHNITKLLLNNDSKSSIVYDYKITVSLPKKTNNLEFLNTLANYGNINIIESNLSNINNTTKDTLTFKIKLNNMDIEFIKNMLIKYNLSDICIVKF